MGWKKQICKQKHKDRINNLLPKCDIDKLKKEISDVLVSADYVIECIKKDKYKDLYNKIIGDFNDGVNRR